MLCFGHSIHKFSLFGLYFFISYIFILSVYPGQSNMYWDSGWYWNFVTSVDFENYPRSFRGYLYPYIIYILKTYSANIGLPTERLFILMNAAAVSMCTVYFMPEIICASKVQKNKYHDRMFVNGITTKRYFIGSAIFFICVLYFWQDYFVYPLSDFPALFCCAGTVFGLIRIDKILQSQEKINKMCVVGLILLSLMTGAFAYATYNIRAIYLYGIVISIILWMVRNRHKDCYVFIACFGIVLGGVLISYPQMYVNKKYNDTYLPKVPTENYSNVDLQNMQLAWGLNFHRYETYTGKDPVQGPQPGMGFYDKAGNILSAKENITGGVSLVQLAGLAVKYPLDLVGIYFRHLVNYLTIVWRQAYILDLHVNTIWVVLPCILLWLIFFYQICLFKCKEWIEWLQNDAWTTVPFFAICLFMIPGAVEVRFFIAGYFIMYSFLSWRLDFGKIWNHFKSNTVSVSLIIFAVLGLWISVIGDTLSSNGISAVIFNYE